MEEKEGKMEEMSLKDAQEFKGGDLQGLSLSLAVLSPPKSRISVPK